MKRLLTLALALVVLCVILALSHTFAQTSISKPSYDIALTKEKVAGPLGTNFRITVKNLGQKIVGPATISIIDNLPAGITVTGGQGSDSTWTITPWGPPTAGPANFTLTYPIPNGTTINTGQTIGWFLFQAQYTNLNCATAKLLVNGVVVPETNTANNHDCK